MLPDADSLYKIKNTQQIENLLKAEANISR